MCEVDVIVHVTDIWKCYGTFIDHSTIQPLIPYSEHDVIYDKRSYNQDTRFSHIPDARSCREWAMGRYDFIVGNPSQGFQSINILCVQSQEAAFQVLKV